ncbi:MULTISPECIES: hypothetical protein [Streptomyces]|nr:MULTISPECIES: hypothetical protein [unclassified Streptomyces]WSC41663.1 hypothetical protein OHA08_43145 [Streptomyces sp. NBC_01763]
MAPSPAADATRLTEPLLTPPAAKTPGRVVSSSNATLSASANSGVCAA